jgi:nucleoside-diphosphate-sugar epimerase
MEKLSIVMMGATGAVGGQVCTRLLTLPQLGRLTLLGRQTKPEFAQERVVQQVVDVFEPQSYRSFVAGHRQAICTLGVGQPSKAAKADFIKIDKDTVLAFAKECKAAGVEHFSLLGSIGADPRSFSFYLRTKGELEQGLRDLQFKRLSLFRPSMILTPQNRYGVSQGVLLKLWPKLDVLLAGPLRCYRGVTIEHLGGAIALNLLRPGAGAEILTWAEVQNLLRTSTV